MIYEKLIALERWLAKAGFKKEAFDTSILKTAMSVDQVAKRLEGKAIKKIINKAIWTPEQGADEALAEWGVTRERLAGHIAFILANIVPWDLQPEERVLALSWLITEALRTAGDDAAPHFGQRIVRRALRYLKRSRYRSLENQPLLYDKDLISEYLALDDHQINAAFLEPAVVEIRDNFQDHFATLERYFQYKQFMSEKDILSINGFSELMVEVFGREMGIGVRSAVGMHLPQNIPVEIEAVFLIEHL